MRPPLSSACPSGSLPRPALDWSPALPSLATAESLVTIGRGPTLSIAREAALKLKETSNLHAEAFSGAEFLHGPVSLVSSRYPILMLMPNDEAAPGLRQLADDLRGKGAALFVAGPDEAAARAAGARAGSAGGGRDLPHAELLRHGVAACGLARDRRRPAAPPEEGDPHPMTALAKAVAGRPPVRRRDRPARPCRGDRRRLHRIGLAAGRAAAGVPGANGCRRAPGSPPVSSTCRSTAAATCCSTTIRHRRRSPRSRRRIGASARPACCRR